MRKLAGLLGLSLCLGLGLAAPASAAAAFDGRWIADIPAIGRCNYPALCKAEARTCPAAKVRPEQFGIQGSGLPGEGFKAILGVNMAKDAAPNPLVALGAKRWIIELPRPGEDKPGRLVINPTDAEVAGYAMVSLDPRFADEHGGLHDAVQGCLVNRASKRSYCGPADLDTGAPGIQVVTQEGEEVWKAGAPATIAFYEKDKPIIGAEFLVGQGPGAHFAVRHEARARGARILLGILPYFVFSTLYDPQARAIGLKAR